MYVAHQIIIMLVTLGILVTIHEYGHYWVAKKCGVKVLRFSIGFGPVLYRWINRHETEFALSLLPLGGYVKMLDEREGSVVEEEKHMAFNAKGVRQRIAIVSAGPLCNLLLAMLVYWFLFLRGTTGLLPLIYDIEPGSLAEQSGLVAGLEIISVDGEETPSVHAVGMQLMNRIGDAGEIVIGAHKPGTDLAGEYRLPIQQWLGDRHDEIDIFADLGIGFYKPFIEPVIEDVMPDSAGERAGLRKGDKLLSADGIAIDDWLSWVDYVRARPDKRIDIEVLREGQLIRLSITPGAKKEGVVIGYVGVQVKVPELPAQLVVKERYDVWSAAVAAASRTWQASVFTLQSMAKIIVGDISYKQLSGPISIARVASESANSGIYSYLSLLALLSVSLGILNLLPIPVLDGGHIFFYLIEWFKGSPVPEKIQQASYQLGMLVVLSVMVLALVNDLGRL